MYDFFNDGTARFSPGAIVPMQYRLDGDRLTTYPVDGPAFTVSFSDDDHLRMSVQGGIEDYVRLGTAAGTGRRLVGEWSGKRNMDGNIVAVHWIFNVDSSAILMIRFLTLQGRYEFRDGRLIATFGNRPLSGPATLANGILSVQHDGKTTRLQRY